ncbi:MAG TPA: hypothetical protein VF020_07625 [Chthoniobacterales bacterium]
MKQSLNASRLPSLEPRARYLVMVLAALALAGILFAMPSYVWQRP